MYSIYVGRKFKVNFFKCFITFEKIRNQFVVFMYFSIILST